MLVTDMIAKLAAVLDLRTTEAPCPIATELPIDRQSMRPEPIGHLSNRHSSFMQPEQHVTLLERQLIVSPMAMMSPFECEARPDIHDVSRALMCRQTAYS